MDALPLELIVEIFFMVRETYACGEKNSRDRFTCPFTLSQVCRRWRVASLHETELWTYIHLGDRAFGDDSAEPEVIDVYRRVLDRSGNAGLHIAIYLKAAWLDVSTFQRTREFGFHNDLFNMVSDAAERWRRLIVSLTKPRIFVHVERVLPRLLPRLQRLEYRNEGHERGEWPFLAVLPECPQLKELVAYHVGFDYRDMGTYSFPLVESVSCHAPLATASKFSKVVPTVKHVHINHCGFTSSGVHHLPHTIRSLSIGVMKVNIRGIFTMTAPELRVLAIECDLRCTIDVRSNTADIPWDRGMPKLKAVALYLQESSPLLPLMTMIDHLPNVWHWVLRRDLAKPPPYAMVEMLAGHISDKIPDGGTITIERPSTPILRLNIRGKTARIRLYRDEFPSTDGDAMTQVERLKEDANVELVDKPNDVLEAALRECDDGTGED